MRTTKKDLLAQVERLGWQLGVVRAERDAIKVERDLAKTERDAARDRCIVLRLIAESMGKGAESLSQLAQSAVELEWKREKRER